MKPRPRPAPTDDDDADMLAWFCALLIDALAIPEVAAAVRAAALTDDIPVPPPAPTGRRTSPPARGRR